MYLKTYQYHLTPMPRMEFWPEVDQKKPLPPIARRMSERPMKKRHGASHESSSKYGVMMTCQNCFEKGHNSKGCKNEKVIREKLPKKKAGRKKNIDLEPTRVRNATEEPNESNKQDEEDVPESIIGTDMQVGSSVVNKRATVEISIGKPPKKTKDSLWC